jgi:hypothetical protein
MRVIITSVFYRLSSKFDTRAAATLATALAITPASALAAAQVSGNPQAVSIIAQNTSIEEILSVLSHEFSVHYNSSVNLDNRLTGTFQGSLQRVLARVLEGYNFVIKMSDGRTELTVLGRRNVHDTVEVLVPAPMPSPSSVSPPVPSSEAVAVVVPELRPSTVAPPVHLVSDPAVLPIPLPSRVLPLAPRIPGG